MEGGRPTSTTATWRPYQDAPLFGPELLHGLDAMNDADRLLRYLEALTARRGTVHTTVAFNAVYFGYDLSFGGYVGGPIDFDTFPQLSAGSTENALPVGAMVSVRAGHRRLYAEVVHREGREEPESSANTTGKGRAERLLFDVDAFSPGTVVSNAQFTRLRAHSRWVDRLGHLHHRVCTPGLVHRPIDEHEEFVRYLLGPGRPQLMAGPLPLLLRDGSGPGQMAAALHGALETIDQALSALPSLRRWRGYAFTRDGLARRLEHQGPLGGPDLDWLVRSVIRPGFGRRGRSTGRTTEVGPYLRALSGAEHDLSGTGYLYALVHANTLIDDHLREHGEEGVLPNGIRVHLADPHHEGGRWITQPHREPGSTPLPPTPRRADEPVPERPRTAAPWRYLVEYEVAPFLRRLPRGQRAGDVARSEYHRLLSRFGLRGDLPDGFTLVRGHSRTRGGPRSPIR